MPRKPEGSVFYGRYCLTTEAYCSLKKDLRRLHNGAPPSWSKVSPTGP